jgi:tight adherence protein B
MDELWIIISLVFVATLLGVGAAYRLGFQATQAHRAVNRRLALSEQHASPTAALDALRRERGFVDIANPVFRHANDLLMQSGLKLNRKLLLLSVMALSAILFFAFGLAFERGLISFLLAILSALALTYLFFRIMRYRRITRFGEQLPEALDVIVRGVRVGYPLSVALSLVAREMPDPIGPEFAMTADEIAFGQDIKTAVDHLYRRVGQEDLLFVVVAISVQSQTGGNIAEVLSRLSRLMRNRAKVHLKIKALSAEGRASAKFLSAMPFILFAVVCLVSPAYFGEVRDHPLIAPALIYALASLLIGNVIMYRMVNFKI